MDNFRISLSLATPMAVRSFPKESHWGGTSIEELVNSKEENQALEDSPLAFPGDRDIVEQVVRVRQERLKKRILKRKIPQIPMQVVTKSSSSCNESE